MTSWGVFVRFFCLFLLLVTGQRANAERKSTLTPKFASISSVRQSAGGSQGGLGFNLVNLSSAPQTVTLKVEEEEFGTFVRVQNPSGITGWDFTEYAGAHQSTTFKPTSMTVTVVLGPNEAKKVAMDGIECYWMLSGCRCYRRSVKPAYSIGFVIDPASPSSAVNFIYDSSLTYAFRLSINVAEDRGAILASANATLGFANVVAPNGPARGVWSMDFNGGRPF